MCQQCHVFLFVHTDRIFFEILLNQPKIRLYLPFSGWFGPKLTSVWFQINRKMVNIIWFWLFWKKCTKTSVHVWSIIWRRRLIVYSQCSLYSIPTEEILLSTQSYRYRLVPKQSENGEYNLISVHSTDILIHSNNLFTVIHNNNSSH